MAKDTSLGAVGLLHTIQLKREEVIALLLTHGVVVNSDASDMEIAIQVTNLAKKSQSFYKAFMQLMMDKSVVDNVYSNMDGNYLGITDFMNDWCNKGDNAKIFPDKTKDVWRLEFSLSNSLNKFVSKIDGEIISINIDSISNTLNVSILV